MVATETRAPSGTAAHGGRAAARKRGLVVDDEEVSRRGLATLAAGWGYTVADAADGKEALDRARVDRPDIVVTDLLMPGFDGLELLRTLQEEVPTATVIVLTGHATVETAVAAMKEGAYDYVTKQIGRA